MTPPVVGSVKTTTKGIFFFFNSLTAKAVRDICIKAIEDSIILCPPEQLKNTYGILFSIAC